MNTALKKARTVKKFPEMIIDEVVDEICCMLRVSLHNIMTQYVYVIGIELHEAGD